MYAAVISAPGGVRVRRLSSTAVEVTWDPPSFHGVAGYRVQYSAAVATHHDDHRPPPAAARPTFLDTGPYTVTQVCFGVTDIRELVCGRPSPTVSP